MPIIFRALIPIYSVLFLSACTSTSSYNAPAAAANVQLGIAYLQEKQYPRAKQHLLLALQQAPGSSDAWAALAYYSSLTDDAQQATQDYQHALHFASNPGQVHNNYGVFLCKQGLYNAAIKEFLQAAENINYANTALAYENAGFCAFQIPDKILATNYFKKALQEDPQLPQSLLHLAAS